MIVECEIHTHNCPLWENLEQEDVESFQNNLEARLQELKEKHDSERMFSYEVFEEDAPTPSEDDEDDIESQDALPFTVKVMGEHMYSPKVGYCRMGIAADKAEQFTEEATTEALTCWKETFPDVELDESLYEPDPENKKAGN